MMLCDWQVYRIFSESPSVWQTSLCESCEVNMYGCCSANAFPCDYSMRVSRRCRRFVARSIVHRGGSLANMIAAKVPSCGAMRIEVHDIPRVNPEAVSIYTCLYSGTADAHKEMLHDSPGPKSEDAMHSNVASEAGMGGEQSNGLLDVIGQIQFSMLVVDIGGFTRVSQSNVATCLGPGICRGSESHGGVVVRLPVGMRPLYPLRVFLTHEWYIAEPRARFYFALFLIQLRFVFGRRRSRFARHVYEGGRSRVYALDNMTANVDERAGNSEYDQRTWRHSVCAGLMLTHEVSSLCLAAMEYRRYSLPPWTAGRTGVRSLERQAAAEFSAEPFEVSRAYDGSITVNEPLPRAEAMPTRAAEDVGESVLRQDALLGLRGRAGLGSHRPQQSGPRGIPPARERTEVQRESRRDARTRSRSSRARSPWGSTRPGHWRGRRSSPSQQIRYAVDGIMYAISPSGGARLGAGHVSGDSSDPGPEPSHIASQGDAGTQLDGGGRRGHGRALARGIRGATGRGHLRGRAQRLRSRQTGGGRPTGNEVLSPEWIATAMDERLQAIQDARTISAGRQGRPAQSTRSQQVTSLNVEVTSSRIESSDTEHLGLRCMEASGCRIESCGCQRHVDECPMCTWSCHAHAGAWLNQDGLWVRRCPVCEGEAVSVFADGFRSQQCHRCSESLQAERATCTNRFWESRAIQTTEATSAARERTIGRYMGLLEDDDHISVPIRVPSSTLMRVSRQVISEVVAAMVRVMGGNVDGQVEDVLTRTTAQAAETLVARARTVTLAGQDAGQSVGGEAPSRMRPRPQATYAATEEGPSTQDVVIGARGGVGKNLRDVFVGTVLGPDQIEKVIEDATGERPKYLYKRGVGSYRVLASPDAINTVLELEEVVHLGQSVRFRKWIQKGPMRHDTDDVPVPSGGSAEGVAAAQEDEGLRCEVPAAERVALREAAEMCKRAKEAKLTSPAIVQHLATKIKPLCEKSVHVRQNLTHHGWRDGKFVETPDLQCLIQDLRNCAARVNKPETTEAGSQAKAVQTNHSSLRIKLALAEAHEGLQYAERRLNFLGKIIGLDVQESELLSASPVDRVKLKEALRALELADENSGAAPGLGTTGRSQALGSTSTLSSISSPPSTGTSWVTPASGSTPAGAAGTIAPPTLVAAPAPMPAPAFATVTAPVPKVPSSTDWVTFGTSSRDIGQAADESLKAGGPVSAGKVGSKSVSSVSRAVTVSPSMSGAGSPSPFNASGAAMASPFTPGVGSPSPFNVSGAAMATPFAPGVGSSSPFDTKPPQIGQTTGASTSKVQDQKGEASIFEKLTIGQRVSVRSASTAQWRTATVESVTKHHAVARPDGWSVAMPWTLVTDKVPMQQGSVNAGPFHKCAACSSSFCFCPIRLTVKAGECAPWLPPDLVTMCLDGEHAKAKAEVERLKIGEEPAVTKIAESVKPMTAGLKTPEAPRKDTVSLEGRTASFYSASAGWKGEGTASTRSGSAPSPAISAQSVQLESLPLRTSEVSEVDWQCAPRTLIFDIYAEENPATPLTAGSTVGSSETLTIASRPLCSLAEVETPGRARGVGPSQLCAIAEAEGGEQEGWADNAMEADAGEVQAQDHGGATGDEQSADTQEMPAPKRRARRSKKQSTEGMQTEAPTEQGAEAGGRGDEDGVGAESEAVKDSWEDYAEESEVVVGGSGVQPETHSTPAADGVVRHEHAHVHHHYVHNARQGEALYGVQQHHQGQEEARVNGPEDDADVPEEQDPPEVHVEEDVDELWDEWDDAEEWDDEDRDEWEDDGSAAWSGSDDDGYYGADSD